MLKAIKNFVCKSLIEGYRWFIKMYLDRFIKRLWYGGELNVNFNTLRSYYRAFYYLELVSRYSGDDEMRILAFNAKMCVSNKLKNTGEYTLDMSFSDIFSTLNKVKAIFNQSEEVEAV